MIHIELKLNVANEDFPLSSKILGLTNKLILKMLDDIARNGNFTGKILDENGKVKMRVSK